jgi:methylmalonyl-CoA mutase C-terminal domain/subunit
MTHRAKIIVGLLGIDQHEVGAIAISSLLRDAGVEVIYLGRFNTPASLIRAALHEDADVIGVSCHSWEYLEYVPELMTMLRSEAVDVDVVLGGSVITAGDAETMRQAGRGDVRRRLKPDQVVADIQALAAARQQRLRGDPRI